MIHVRIRMCVYSYAIYGLILESKNYACVARMGKKLILNALLGLTVKKLKV